MSNIRLLKATDDGIAPSFSTTAATLIARMQAADSNLADNHFNDVNYIIIHPVTTNLRYSVGGTPTTTKGVLLTADTTHIIQGVNPRDLNLVAASGTPTAHVILGQVTA